MIERERRLPIYFIKEALREDKGQQQQQQQRQQQQQ